MDGKTFGNSEEYYGENAERRYSVEADYGFHWRLDGEPERWRVSYVRNTGEVYAVRLAGTGSGRDVVEVLGAFPIDPEAGLHDIYYRGLVDAHLDGWGVRCGLPGSLSWVRERMALAVKHRGAMPGESTHLLGTRDATGVETALCRAQDGLLYIPRHLLEDNRARVRCPECVELQNQGPMQSVTVRAQPDPLRSCRCCGRELCGRNDGRKALRETWRELTVTWVCSFCLDDEDHRFVLPAADVRGMNSQNRQLSGPTVSGPTVSGPPR